MPKIDLKEMEQKVAEGFKDDSEKMKNDEAIIVNESEVPESVKKDKLSNEVKNEIPEFKNEKLSENAGKVKLQVMDNNSKVNAAFKSSQKKTDAGFPSVSQGDTDKKKSQAAAVKNDNELGDRLGLDDKPIDKTPRPIKEDDGAPPEKSPDDGLVLDDSEDSGSKNDELIQNDQVDQDMEDKIVDGPLPVDVTPNQYPPMLPEREIDASQVSYAPLGCLVVVSIILLFFIFKPRKKYSKLSQQESNKSI
eukprot:NODE_371_length_9954_cov_0.100355.p5 type:complete len:249 gc:universal NODE_371_length_9954_cov_0.100355:1159-1905(+)